MRDDRGSALMLIPAGVLVLLVLAAIAVDSAVVFMAQRELNNRAAAAANDIAGMLVDDEAFYRSGQVAVVDDDAADRYVDSVFDESDPPAGFERVAADAVLDRTRRVVVRAEGDVRWIFAGALPGLKGLTTVRAEAETTSIGG